MATIRTDQAAADANAATGGRWSFVTLVGLGEFLCSVALGYAYLVSGTSSITIGFAVGTFLFSLSLPFVLYRDYRRLERAGLGWDANLARYLAGGMIGASFVIISVVVAGVYLYQRHRRLSLV